MLPRALVPLLLVSLLEACQQYTIDGKEDPISEPEEETDLAPATFPDLVVEPASLDFGPLALDCATEQLVTLTNVGDAQLVVEDVTLAGVDVAAFSELGEPMAIAPGDSRRVRVTFTASQVAAYAAQLDVRSNDPDTPTVAVPLAGEGAELATAEDLFEQVAVEKADVLFVIDNSPSMGEEVYDLASKLDVFIDGFVQLGLDFVIGVTTTDFSQDGPGYKGEIVGPLITSADLDPVGAFVGQTFLGFQGSSTERGFDAAYKALSAPLINQENAGLLRPDATLSVVIVSDEDDASSLQASNSPRAIASFLEGLKVFPGTTTPDPNLSSLSAITGPESPSGFGATYDDACGDEWTFGPVLTTAPDYHDAIARTGGVWGDMCDLDPSRMTDFLDALVLVAAGYRDTFRLSFPPYGDPATAITVTVDGAPVDNNARNGWTYDAATQSVVLHGSAIPQPGEEVFVTYPYAPTCF
jgi:hypothetical protein